MKINRTKRAQKHLQFYSNIFGFREPYQLLVDGTFCLQAIKYNIQIAQQIQKYLQVEIKIVTTACVIIETESLGAKFIGTAKILKEFKVHKCGHEKSPLSGQDCIKYMCKQSHYIIATQDRQLQDELRRKVGVPLLYFHNAAPTLEQPSDESYRVANKRAKTGLGVSESAIERLKQLKEKEGLVTEPVIEKTKHRKKGGPNPLSCKKKKVKISNNAMKATSTVKNGIGEKKSNRKKIPKHVKELLKAEMNKTHN